MWTTFCDRKENQIENFKSNVEFLPFMHVRMEDVIKIVIGTPEIVVLTTPSIYSLWRLINFEH